MAITADMAGVQLSQTVVWHVTAWDDMDARPVLSSDKEVYIASICFSVDK